MENKKELTYRMYSLVLYSLSGIQQGIQAGHATVEYSLKYGRNSNYKRWAEKDKTVIILNGGTSNRTGTNEYGLEQSLGTMEQHWVSLNNANITHAEFYEPDLNNAMTAISFLVDERVWDVENYPTPKFNVVPERDNLSNKQLKELYNEKEREALSKEYGDDVAFLRIWLRQFRLA